MSEAEHSEDAHAHDGHEHNYIRIWGILVVLLIISVVGPFIGEYTEIQAITLVTAFGIAAYKAYLVVKNFMHMTAEKAFVSYIVVTCLVFMFLLYAGTAPDVMKSEGSGWEKPLWQQQEAEYAARQAALAHGGEDGHGDDHH
ncbi:MAG: cytochrome C oxidase subunit IV family protein [Myxococcota bacterium]|nr:cytochrome C oxidase subunit IV family protein [Myxococcota bacterium]